MAALRLSQVSLSYGSGCDRALVLDRVSFSVEAGAFVSVVGRSGSGKTSLLNVAAGFLAPDTGRVEVDGTAVTGPSAERAVVFQDDALFPWRSVAENVALPLAFKGVERAVRREQALHLLEQVGLRDQADKRVWQLSGGQRQRVGIARALAANPRYLLMDEPLGALDAMTREQMHDTLLRVWAGTRAGALLITHSVEEAVFLSTTVVVLAPNPGRVSYVEDLNFGRRFLAGEEPRALKSEPAFIAARERLLAAIYNERAVA